MYFLNPRTHAIRFFISSKILPIDLIYFEVILHSMYDVSNNSAPKDFSEKFIKTSFIHITRGLHLVANIIKFLQLNE